MRAKAHGQDAHATRATINRKMPRIRACREHTNRLEFINGAQSIQPQGRTGEIAGEDCRQPRQDGDVLAEGPTRRPPSSKKASQVS